MRTTSQISKKVVFEECRRDLIYLKKLGQIHSYGAKKIIISFRIEQTNQKNIHSFISICVETWKKPRKPIQIVMPKQNIKKNHI